MNEKTLNSFLSSNLDRFGLVHINSEVPKKLPKETKKPDIIAYDRESRIPVFLELKAARNAKAISQVCDYLEKIPSGYPNIMEELAAFKIQEGFKFNYNFGIFGLIISPEPPPNPLLETTQSIGWAQYDLSENRFRIIQRHLLSSRKGKPSVFDSRTDPNILRPSTLVQSRWPRLRHFSELMNDAFISVSQSIYLRPNEKNNYVAYYTTNGTYAIFGISTGKNRTTYWVTYHIRKQHTNRFLQLPEIKSLAAFGVSQASRQDKGNYFIFPFVINEQIVSEPTRVLALVEQFKSLGQFSFSLERDTAIDQLSIAQESIDSLCLRHFGITV